MEAAHKHPKDYLLFEQMSSIGAVHAPKTKRAPGAQLRSPRTMALKNICGTKMEDHREKAREVANTLGSQLSAPYSAFEIEYESAVSLVGAATVDG